MPVHTVTVDVGGRPLTLETGLLAKQADGAVVVRQNDSAVLATIVTSKDPLAFGDFLPLSCDYMDRTGAYGRIPGGFLKREGRANERETLIGRLMDRPIRPQFPKHFRNEIQIIATVFSYDPTCDTDVLAMCGAAAAAHISDTPMKRPIAGVRVSEVGGQLVINPSREQMDEATITLIVAGTSDAICMVEGGAKNATEARMLEAMYLAHDEIKKICAGIEELREKAGVAKREVPKPAERDAAAVKAVSAHKKALVKALGTKGKHERKVALKEARTLALEQVVAGIEAADELVRLTKEGKEAWDDLIRQTMRANVIERGERVDGRATDEIRDITCQVGVAKRAHGSAVFTRGETQVFATATLGVEQDAQRIDFAGAEADSFRRFMLTYNFPPFCTGEVKRMGSPKRREVGHGALAHRAVEAVVPPQETFPYVLRCTADVLESNGSSSMATVCASTLALLDAGVPLIRPVAGIAMGLIKEGNEFAVLSDILGDEDHLGDMDFKVTGSNDGITAFQMDVKIDGVSRDVMVKALAQAKEGRQFILGKMAEVMPEARKEMSPFAPRITTVQIHPDKIRDIIGPGGKVIRGIQDATGTRLTVEDNGKVSIASTDGKATEKAVAMIRELTQEAEIGKLYLGVVKRIVDFGAFVEIFPGTDGLIHISHLAKERVDKVTDVVNEGDEVLVRVIDIDKAGKIRLSRKDALEASAM
jgi:polyribonucleotide nucleotidyltransferase